MIDVQKMILEVMKKQRFSTTAEESAAARSVLSELKTKQIDLRFKGAIDAMTQHKVIAKMKSDRENSATAFTDAGRPELAANEELQAKICTGLLDILAPELPQQLSEDEIRSIIGKILAENPAANMGAVMQAFKNEANIDRKLVSRIAAEMLKK